MYDGRRTSALLIAGRVLDQCFPTVGHVRALRRLAAPRGLTVVVAGDETYRGAPSEPEDPLPVRVAIGVPILVVTADDPPLGPVDPAAVNDALELVGGVGELWWRTVGRELGAAAVFAPAQRRASLPERLQALLRGRRLRRAGWDRLSSEGPSSSTRRRRLRGTCGSWRQARTTLAGPSRRSISI